MFCLKRNMTYGVCFILLNLFAMRNIHAQNRTRSLPEPVKKYLDLVLPKDPRQIKEVELTHNGFFKSSLKSDWVKIKGKQYFKTETPEFEWTGETSMFKASDRYMDGKGRLRVKLFGLIPIVNARGPEVDQAELLRWLGESVWFPTNLIPGDQLSWSPINSSSAKLNYSHKDQKLWYIINFDEKGYIVRLETERYLEKGKPEKWIGKVSDYKDFHGFIVPSHIEAFWELEEEGDFQYVDFYVQSIKYEY